MNNAAPRDLLSCHLPDLSPSTPHLPLLQPHTGLGVVPSAQQAYTCLWAFALTVPAAYNALPCVST